MNLPLHTFRKLAFLPIFAGMALTACVAQDVSVRPPMLGAIAKGDPNTDYGVVANFVAKLLQGNHYDHKPFDGETVKHSVKNLIESLDPQKLYFTKTEVDTFMTKYSTTLDDFVFNSDLTPGTEIYLIYKGKIIKRFEKIRAFVESKEFDLASERTVPLNRRKMDYAATEEELDGLWKDRITSDILEQRLQKRLADEKKAEKKEKDKDKAPEPAAEAKPPVKPEKTPEEKVLSRYKRILDAVHETDEEDVTNLVLTSICQAYDPHSEYMSAPEEDRFKVEMGKTLIGIGAQLQMDPDDNLPTIDKLVRGGPALKSGLIKAKDKILAVGQGDDGELEEVEGLKLDRVVQKIRGAEGSKVKLKVLPAADPTTTKEIIITRAVVPMNETKAKAQLVEITNKDGQKQRYGWLIIDSFYADMSKRNAGVTRDVIPILDRLMKEKIEGLVIDLRGNGGGSLDEALLLTGLFIDRGPVVQVRTHEGKIDQRNSKGNGPMYGGPLVVMTDRISASASEIFAAAVQDYGRGVVVGDHATFGKGTVQTVMDLFEALPPGHKYPRAGSLKVTIQKFYRIAGGSTQLKGVTPDVILPSQFEGIEVGEDTMDYPLKYDEIPMASYKPAEQSPVPAKPLVEKSKARVAADPEFAYIAEEVKHRKKQIDENKLTLNLEKRLAEIRENKAKFEKRKTERKARREAINKTGDPYMVYEINVENVNQEKLLAVEEVKKEHFMVGAEDEDEDVEIEDFPHDLDPVKMEGLAILRDLIAEKPEGKTAQASPPASNP